ncbi:MAG TPA: PaaI family thioesterase [Acidimicrobiales bacterium]|nr:PaaI family thioesterase [Acidimicrobiales bacterium]
MSEPWSERMRQALDEEPSPRRAEARRLGDAVRALIERASFLDAPAEELGRAADAVEGLVEALSGYPRTRQYEGFAESANAGTPDGFFDHSPIMGAANPLAPPVRLESAGDKVVGTVRFGAAYEGPPGCAHGGYIAAVFDEVLGMAQSMGGNPGMTGTLTVRYRRPTPLHRTLRLEGELVRVEGRKIFTAGRCLLDGEVTAEAEGIFISVDFSRLAALYAARQEGAGG